jgi:hypothetical protein
MPALVRAIVVDDGLIHRPRPEKQRVDAMVKYIQERTQRLVFMMPRPIDNVFGQVNGHRAIRSQQSGKAEQKFQALTRPVPS